jgi:hypothetical protein
MKKELPAGAFIKWAAVGLAGTCFLAGAFVCYRREAYTYVLALAFAGCFLLTSGWKKLRLLRAAVKALRTGKESVTIFYRDHNLNESENAVIPVGTDTLYFYGFSPQKMDIKVFRWNRIIRAVDNGKELNREDLIRSAAG